jgi:hypothetical protein
MIALLDLKSVVQQHEVVYVLIHDKLHENIRVRVVFSDVCER